MLTRKNKSNNINQNKKTRREVLQKGGGCTPDADGRKGVDNIGNTCYLNSLYQLLYSIDGFSALIQSYQHENIESVLNVTQLDKMHIFYIIALDSEYADRIQGKNTYYNQAKNDLVSEIKHKNFGPVTQHKLLCILLNKIFNKICNTPNIVLSYEPFFIPLILFPDDDPIDKQQDSNDALNMIISKIPLLGNFIQHKIKTGSANPSGDLSSMITIYAVNDGDSVSSCIATNLKQEDKENKNNNRDVAYTDFKQYIVIYCSRHDFDENNRTYTKKNKKIINIDNFLTLENKKYKICGIIKHSGNTTNSGHYIFADKTANRIIDDLEVINFSEKDKYDSYFKNESMASNWAMLLYKKDDSQSSSQNVQNVQNTDLYELIDNNDFSKFIFVNNNNLNNMEEMLIETPDLIDDKYGDSEMTALMYQTRYGTLEAMDFLIANGADINSKDKNGHTAIFYAINHTGIDVSKIRLLVSQHNIDLTVKYNAPQEEPRRNPIEEAERIFKSNPRLHDQKKQQEILDLLTPATSTTSTTSTPATATPATSKTSTSTTATSTTPVKKQILIPLELQNGGSFGNVLKIPYFTNYRDRRTIYYSYYYEIDGKIIYYVNQYVPFDKEGNNDNYNLVFLPHFWKTQKIINGFLLKGELTVYDSKFVKLLDDNYNKHKSYSIHDDAQNSRYKLLSDATEVPENIKIEITNRQRLYVTFKWKPFGETDELETFNKLDKSDEMFYGVYDFFQNGGKDTYIDPTITLKKNETVKNETTIIDNMNEFYKQIISKQSTQSKPKPTEPKPKPLSFEPSTQEITYKKNEFTYDESDKTYKKNELTFKENDSFLIQTGNRKTGEISKPQILTIKKVEENQIIGDVNKKEIIINEKNIQIFDNVTENQKLNTEKNIQIFDNVTKKQKLNTEKNKKIVQQNQDTTPDLDPKITTITIIDPSIIEELEEKKKQLKEKIDSLLLGTSLVKSINESMPNQPSNESEQIYTIEFDVNGKIKIVTDQTQNSTQSLSAEIEDHYFNKNPGKYKPKDVNKYTVTVTKDTTGKITNIKI